MSARVRGAIAAAAWEATAYRRRHDAKQRAIDVYTCGMMSARRGAVVLALLAAVAAAVVWRGSFSDLPTVQPPGEQRAESGDGDDEAELELDTATATALARTPSPSPSPTMALHFLVEDEAGMGAALVEARRAIEADDPAQALEVLEPLEQAAGLEQLPPPMRYSLAIALEASGRLEEAVAAYESYGDAVPAMSDIGAMAAGQALFAAGNYDEALEKFTLARDTAGDDNTAFLAALRRGNSLLRIGPPESAIAAYQEAYTLAGDDDQHALALSGRIAVLEDAGDSAGADQARLQLVRNHATAELAPMALENLLAAGRDVTPVEHAAVRAAAGDHATAVQVLERAIQERSEVGGETYLRLAQYYQAIGATGEAVQLAERTVAAMPSDPVAPELQWLRMRWLQRLDRLSDAAEAANEFAESWSDEARAPTALLSRALIIDQLSGPSESAAEFVQLVERYPDSAEAPEARFRAGLAYWRSHQVPRAAEHWTALAENTWRSQSDRARGEYWLGRMSYDLGNEEVAAGHWRSGASLDPDGFYGLAAAARLRELDHASTTPASTAAAFATADAQMAVDAIGEWLALWREDASPDRWSEALVAVPAMRSVERGRQWLALGKPNSALSSLRNANAELWSEPVAQAVLALAATEMGVYRVASSAAQHVLDSAPAEVRRRAPAALRRLAYPDAYGELVRAAAAENGIPPDLYFALIRQESRFDPNAVSTAGATGLTQVMPATGRQIAARLGDGGFDTSDLLQPETSLGYGAWYLARQLESFDGLVYPALAAYNGGPGNSRRWLEASGVDMDLFAELIDFSETRRYVRLVTEHRAQYSQLYEWAPDDSGQGP